MNLGDNIKSYRKEKGLTQVELAKKSNISRSYLADIEKNRYNPSLDTLRSISNALAIELNCLITSQDNNDTLNNLSFQMQKIVEHINKITDGNISDKNIEKFTKIADIVFDEVQYNRDVLSAQNIIINSKNEADAWLVAENTGFYDESDFEQKNAEARAE